jgi:DNA-binding beta-propeller fold protein YncE
MGAIESPGTPGRHALAALLCLCGTLLLGLPASAAAALPESLWQAPANGIKGPGAGRLDNALGIATDPGTGHVYVTDRNNARVNEYDAWGQFVQAWGWDVAPDGAPGDTAADEFEACGLAEPEASPPPGLCQKGKEGSGPGQFKALRGGIAIDPASGDVYVSDMENRRVEKFDPTGGLGGKAGFLLAFGSPGEGDGQFEFPGFGNRLAVGPAGTVFAGDSKGRVKVFEPDGTPKPQITLEGLGESVQSLAMDGSGNFYVLTSGDQANIHKFGPTGSELPTIPSPAELFAESPIALDAAGNIYVVVKAPGGGSEVVEFGPTGTPVIAPGSGFALQGLSVVLKGLATNTVTAAGATAVYISTSSAESTSFAASFGPPPDKWPPPVQPPEIISQFAASVDSDSALLRAQINPLYWADTSYYVEYGTGLCSGGGCTQQLPAPPGAQLGAGVVSKVVTSKSLAPQGLAPGTTYHYRFVAQSSGGGPVRGTGGKPGLDGAEGTFKTPPLESSPIDTCPNAQFRKGAAARLPDCRAYEMVSPVDKNNTDILAPIQIREIPAALNQAAVAGGKLTYSTSQGFGDSKGTPYISQYVASRDPGQGWLSHGVSPPQGLMVLNVGLGAEVQFRYFSPDLCNAVLLDATDPPLDPAAPAGFANFYWPRGLCGGSEAYDALSTAPPPSIKPPAFIPDLQGATADGRCAAFNAPEQLTPDANPDVAGGDQGGTNLQLYKSCDGVLSLVSALPGGEASKANNSLGTGNGERIRHASVANALSENGSRAYWTAGDGVGPLYVRAEQPGGGEVTLPVSGAVSPGESGRFWAASEDGSRALFTAAGSLYEFSLGEEGGELVSGVSLVAGGAVGVMGASEDASRAYLVSTQALPAAPNPQGASPHAGSPNLYLRDIAGEAEELSFVGTLSADDARIATFVAPSPLHASPFRHIARISPDGRHLAFTSSASLTGYDNTDASSGKADAEVFLYSAGAVGELACVSCNPSGARPSGRELLLEATPTGVWAASSIPGYALELYGSRVLSDDGSRVFFNSFEALAHGDTNGKADVYQWEELGAGGSHGCDEGDTTFDSAAGGCISLVSSGQSPAGSEFVDASADGADVFFATSSSLVAQDPGLIDIYDARAGGGFPPPAPPPAPCEGEACQPPAAVPPAPPTASSIPGPPNEKAKKAKKKKKGAKKHRKGKGKKGKGRAKHKQGRGQR